MRAVKLSRERGETAPSFLQKSLTAPHPRLRERLLALALIADGQPAKHVARQLGRSRGTGADWVVASTRRGWPDCPPTCRRQPGIKVAPHRVDPAAGHRPAVPTPGRAHDRDLDGEGVAAFVKRTLGQTISAATGLRYLHRLGCGRKPPRKRFVRAKPEAQ